MPYRRGHCELRAARKTPVAANRERALLLVEGAEHARSIVHARAQYAETVYAFLDEFAGEPA